MWRLRLPPRLCSGHVCRGQVPAQALPASVWPGSSDDDLYADVSNVSGVIALRDSKDPGCLTLPFPPDEWPTFTVGGAG